MNHDSTALEWALSCLPPFIVFGGGFTLIVCNVRSEKAKEKRRQHEAEVQEWHRHGADYDPLYNPAPTPSSSTQARPQSAERTALIEARKEKTGQREKIERLEREKIDSQRRRGYNTPTGGIYPPKPPPTKAPPSEYRWPVVRTKSEATAILRGLFPYITQEMIDDATCALDD